MTKSKPTGGRPRKYKRGCILTAYVSFDANRAVRERARREGRTISSIVTDALLAPIIPPNADEGREWK